MAGVIEIAPQVEWSAATWLYERVLIVMRECCEDPKLKKSLHHAIESKVGWFSIPSYSPADQIALLSVLRTHLVPEWNRTLTPILQHNQEVLAVVQTLADLAIHATPPNGEYPD